MSASAWGQADQQRRAMESSRSFLRRVRERMGVKSYSPPPVGNSPRVFWTDRPVKVSAEHIRRDRRACDRLRMLLGATAIGVFLVAFSGVVCFLVSGNNVHHVQPPLVAVWMMLVAASYSVLMAVTLAVFVGMAGMVLRACLFGQRPVPTGTIPVTSPLRRVRLKKRPDRKRKGGL